MGGPQRHHTQSDPRLERNLTLSSPRRPRLGRQPTTGPPAMVNSAHRPSVRSSDLAWVVASSETTAPDATQLISTGCAAAKLIRLDRRGPQRMQLLQLGLDHVESRFERLDAGRGDL
jgi:hypothetical protein